MEKFGRKMRGFLGDFYGLEAYVNADSAGTSFGEFNNDSIAELKALLVEKVKYKELGSIVGGDEVRRSRVKISLAFGKNLSY